MDKRQNYEFIILFHSSFLRRIEAIIEVIENNNHINSLYLTLLISECTDGLTAYLKLIHQGHLKDIDLWSVDSVKNAYKKLIENYVKKFNEKFIYRSKSDWYTQ